MTNEYESQAVQFLADTKTEFSIVYLFTGPYFDDEQESRDVYQFTLKNARGIYSAKFGDSIANRDMRAWANNAPGASFPKKFRKFSDYSPEVMRARIEWKKYAPSAYDVLACLQKYDVGSFANFCGDFGYDADSKKAEKVYFAVQEEWDGLRRLFTAEQLAQLQEIN